MTEKLKKVTLEYDLDKWVSASSLEKLRDDFLCIPDIEGHVERMLGKDAIITNASVSAAVEDDYSCSYARIVLDLECLRPFTAKELEQEAKDKARRKKRAEKEALEKAKAKENKAKKEYENYLRLKKKYESESS